MILFGLKHVGLAMLLVMSLLTPSSAACMCSQPESSAASEGECHSHHEEERGADASGTAALAGESCVCIIDQRTPCISSKSESKELKSKAPLYYRQPISIALKTSEINLTDLSLPVVPKRLSYSTTLRSLLPARAPPRL